MRSIRLRGDDGYSCMVPVLLLRSSLHLAPHLAPHLAQHLSPQMSGPILDITLGTMQRPEMREHLAPTKTLGQWGVGLTKTVELWGVGLRKTHLKGQRQEQLQGS